MHADHLFDLCAGLRRETLFIAKCGVCAVDDLADLHRHLPRRDSLRSDTEDIERAIDRDEIGRASCRERV